jgi:hypothetical protein
VWGEEAPDVTTRDVLDSDADQRSALEEAVEFIAEELKDDYVKADEMNRLCAKAGITTATARRAKKKLGVRTWKKGFGDTGFWVWELPAKDAQDGGGCKGAHEGAHTSDLSTLEEVVLKDQVDPKVLTKVLNPPQSTPKVLRRSSFSHAPLNEHLSDSPPRGEWQYGTVEGACVGCGEYCITLHSPTSRVLHPACASDARGKP